MKNLLNDNIRKIIYDFTNRSAFKEKFNSIPIGVQFILMKRLILLIFAAILVFSFSIYLLDVRIIINATILLLLVVGIAVYQWYLIFYTDKILIAKGKFVSIHRYSILHGINGNTRYKLYFRNDDTGTVYSCYISGILYLTKYTLSPILKEGKEIEVYFHQNLAKADGNSLFISKYLFFVY